MASDPQCSLNVTVWSAMVCFSSGGGHQIRSLTATGAPAHGGKEGPPISQEAPRPFPKPTNELSTLEAHFI